MSQTQEVVYVIATSKVDTVRIAEKEYGIRAANIDPEEVTKTREPLSDDSAVQASWKDYAITRGVSVPPHVRLAVLTADTVFRYNGVTYHKPGNEDGRPSYGDTPIIDATTNKRYLREAISMYSQEPFHALWSNALILHIVNTLNRIAVLDIEVDFPEPISPERVNKIYQSNLNTRVRLAEEALAQGIPFFVSNRGRGEKNPISGEIATNIIVNRVIPLDWFDQIRTNRPAGRHKDRYGNRGLSIIDFDRRVHRR